MKFIKLLKANNELLQLGNKVYNFIQDFMLEEIHKEYINTFKISNLEDFSKERNYSLLIPIIPVEKIMPSIKKFLEEHKDYTVKDLLNTNFKITDLFIKDICKEIEPFYVYPTDL